MNPVKSAEKSTFLLHLWPPITPLPPPKNKKESVKSVCEGKKERKIKTLNDHPQRKNFLKRSLGRNNNYSWSRQIPRQSENMRLFKRSSAPPPQLVRMSVLTEGETTSESTAAPGLRLSLPSCFSECNIDDLMACTGTPKSRRGMEF